MDSQHYYDIVKVCRSTLNSITAKREEERVARNGHAPSPTTTAGYEKLARQLMADAETVGDLMQRAQDTTSSRTWYRRRAALIHYAATAAEQALQTQTRLQRTDPGSENWIREVERLKAYTDLLQSLMDAPPLEPEKRKPRHSKKKDLRYLPDDWRQIIVKRMPKYRAEVLTAALTGCRPAELALGVKWNLDSTDNTLHAFIWGAKVTDTAGQEWRELSFPIEGELAEMLRDLMIANNGHLHIQIENPARFTNAIRSAGKRAFPKLNQAITAYSFRHQASADAKAKAIQSGNPKEALLEVSAALGHYSDKTKGIYGDERQARSGSVTPAKVTQHRKVKAQRKVSYTTKSKHIKSARHE